jgi:hypothetical protein
MSAYFDHASDSTLESTSPSPNFVYVTNDIAIDGGLSNEGMDYLVKHFQSILYICNDDIDQENPDFG